jgi:hypothetical protein
LRAGYTPCPRGEMKNAECRKKGRGAFLEKTVKRDSNGVN